MSSRTASSRRKPALALKDLVGEIDFDPVLDAYHTLMDNARRYDDNRETGCLETHLAGHKQYVNIRITGYGTSGGRVSKTILIHHVLYLCTTGFFPDFNNEKELSHLCHNPRCCNADHIVAEPHDENMARFSCLVLYRNRISHDCPHDQLSAGRKCILPTVFGIDIETKS